MQRVVTSVLTLALAVSIGCDDGDPVDVAPDGTVGAGGAMGGSGGTPVGGQGGMPMGGQGGMPMGGQGGMPMGGDGGQGGMPMGGDGGQGGMPMGGDGGQGGMPMGGDGGQGGMPMGGQGGDGGMGGMPMGGQGGDGGMGGMPMGGQGGDGGMGGMPMGGMGGEGGMVVEPVNDCEGYCDLMAANCGDVYADRDTCLATCALFPADGEIGAVDGNTLQCRIYHGDAAGEDAELHCPHAAAEGGNVCGSYCEVYCGLVQQTCAGDNALYADDAACLEACAAFPADGDVSAVAGDSVQCRIYHGGVPAAADPALHCPHAGIDGGGVCDAPLECAGVQEIAVGDVVEGVTEGEGIHNGTCSLQPNNAAEAIFTFTPEADIEVCLNAAGSDFDTVVYTQIGCDGEEVACNDDNFAVNGNNRSAADLAATAGTTYYIFVDGYNGAVGNYQLTISDLPCGVVRCDEETPCEGERDLCVDGICEEQECLNDEQCFLGDVCVDNTCVECNADDQCGEGVCLENSCVDCVEDADCNEEGLSHCVANTCVACVDDAGCGDGEACVANVCAQEAGSCRMPELLELDVPVMGNNEGRPDTTESSCQGNTGAEIVYLLNVADGGDVCLTTNGSAYDTVLHVRTACEDGESEVACDDDGGNGTQSELTLTTEAGVDYFVYLDAFSNRVGDYVLTATPGACGACDADRPCPEGEVCGEEGLCVAGDCIDDAGCEEGVCEANNCVDCRDDAGCEEGVCEANACVECREDADCAEEGATCNNNFCIGAGGTCAMPLALGFDEAPQMGVNFGRPDEAEASCQGLTGSEVVFSFNAGAGGPVCLTTEGSTYDTVLHVRTECANAESEVACNDDAIGVQSEVTLETAEDTEYFVILDAYSNREGNFVLNATSGPCGACDADRPCPEGEVCGAEGICVEGDCVADEDCPDGVCEANNCVECRDDEGCPEGVCENNACVECRDDAQCADNNICVDNACEPPLACVPPIEFAIGDPVMGTTEGATAVHTASCSGDEGEEVIFQFTPEADGTVCLITDADYDTVLYVRSTCENPDAEVACNDDIDFFGGNTNSRIELEVTGDTTYFVFFDAFDLFAEGVVGNYNLISSVGACPEE